MFVASAMCYTKPDLPTETSEEVLDFKARHLVSIEV